MEDARDSRHIERLTGLALGLEVDSVSAFLRVSIDQIRQMHAVSDGSVDPMFACLSMAIERTLKLSIGFAAVADGELWPDRSAMQGHGHKLDATERTVRDLLVGRTGSAVNPALLRGAIAAAEQDPLLPLIFTSLTRYADMGRYDRSDFLGRTPQPGPSPGALWQEIEQAVRAADPSLADERPPFLERLSKWKMATAEATERAVITWFTMIRTAWIQSALGPDARTYSSALVLPRPG